MTRRIKKLPVAITGYTQKEKKNNVMIRFALYTFSAASPRFLYLSVFPSIRHIYMIFRFYLYNKYIF